MGNSINPNSWRINHVIYWNDIFFTPNFNYSYVYNSTSNIFLSLECLFENNYISRHFYSFMRIMKNGKKNILNLTMLANLSFIKSIYRSFKSGKTSSLILILQQFNNIQNFSKIFKKCLNTKFYTFSRKYVFNNKKNCVKKFKNDKMFISTNMYLSKNNKKSFFYNEMKNSLYFNTLSRFFPKKIILLKNTKLNTNSKTFYFIHHYYTNMHYRLGKGNLLNICLKIRTKKNKKKFRKLILNDFNKIFVKKFLRKRSNFGVGGKLKKFANIFKFSRFNYKLEKLNKNVEIKNMSEVSLNNGHSSKRKRKIKFCNKKQKMVAACVLTLLFYFKFCSLYRLKEYIRLMLCNYNNFPLWEIKIYLKMRHYNNFINSYLILRLMLIKISQFYKPTFLIFRIAAYLRKSMYKKNFLSGFKIIIMGRFSRRDRSYYKSYYTGVLKTSSRISKVDYKKGIVIMPFSLCAIHVWLNLESKPFRLSGRVKSLRKVLWSLSFSKYQNTKNFHADNNFYNFF